MFTYQDFLNIFSYLKTGSTTELDPNMQSLALSEQAKSRNFFEATIDQAAFSSEDWKRLRQFLIDWYSSHKTMVTTQKNASDIYAIPEAHLNELFYCFGFDIGTAIKNIPLDNKINFFYDLINLYKIKGTPQALFRALNYFGLPTMELYEYWLITTSSNELLLRGQRVLATPGVLDLGDTYVDFRVTENDPHWLLTESQILNMLQTNDIRLPSKTPYYGIRPTYGYEIQSTMAYVSRKCQDDYDTWSVTHSLPRDIKCSLGFMVSFLELYLGCIYTFLNYYAPYGRMDQNFLCYDGTSLPSYEIVNAEFNALTAKGTSRDETRIRYNLYMDMMSRPVVMNFLSTYGGPGPLLEIINPEFKTEIDYYIAASKQDEVIRFLFSDLGLWLRANMGVVSSALPSYVLDFESYAMSYVNQVSQFFKPYHARLLFTEKVYKIGNPIADTCITEDLMAAVAPEELIYDYDTGNSDPGFYGDSTSNDYYSREHFDNNSYFDIGASIDEEEIPIDVQDEYRDVFNCHDSTATIHYAYTLESGEVVYAEQDGGFTNYDSGGYFDSPTISDYCQVIVVDS